MYAHTQCHCTHWLCVCVLCEVWERKQERTSDPRRGEEEEAVRLVRLKDNMHASTRDYRIKNTFYTLTDFSERERQPQSGTSLLRRTLSPQLAQAG